MKNAEQIAEEIIQLFKQHGDGYYDSEPVSKTSHMIQCAVLAGKEDADEELILGAFLHDIGYLLKHRQLTEARGEFGIKNQEGMGAVYLHRLGFSERVCSIVNMHVQAKRYLVATDKRYKAKLLPECIETLKWGGGLMSQEDVNTFRHHPFFNDIIKVTMWDEAAKDAKATLLPLNLFKKLTIQHLTLRSRPYEPTGSLNRI